MIDGHVSPAIPHLGPAPRLHQPSRSSTVGNALIDPAPGPTAAPEPAAAPGPAATRRMSDPFVVEGGHGAYTGRTYAGYEIETQVQHSYEMYETVRTEDAIGVDNETGVSYSHA